MSAGKLIKQGMKVLFDQFAGDVLIIKNYQKENELISTVLGMKNADKHNPNIHYYEFPERLDIAVGDLIQQVGSKEFWKVVDTADDIVSGEYIWFKVYVEKIRLVETVNSAAV